MSENIRLAAIVAVFVVMGAILWTVLPGDPDAPMVTTESGVPEIEINSAEVPEFDFDDSSSRSGVESARPTSNETRTSTRGETVRQTTNSSADAKPDGQASIKGTINMIVCTVKQIGTYCRVSLSYSFP